MRVREMPRKRERETEFPEKRDSLRKTDFERAGQTEKA